jgi:hypothetical protein
MMAPKLLAGSHTLLSQKNWNMRFESFTGTGTKLFSENRKRESKKVVPAGH